MFYTLVFIVSMGQQHMLGEFGSNTACQNAIREIYLSQLAVDARNNEVVMEAIDLVIRHQRQYVCLPKYKS